MSSGQPETNHARFTLQQITAVCGGAIVGGADGAVVTEGVSCNTRTLEPGDLIFTGPPGGVGGHVAPA